jgi:dTDP-4-dehydrorhamnose reductase
MIKTLLTGASGQIGSELKQLLPELGQLIAPDRRTLDLVDTNALRTFIRTVKPELVINAAAYTAVDRAEDEAMTARAVNVTAPMIIAEEANNIDAAFIHYSTDYVFDGEKSEPYVETDLTHPLNTYGSTKLAGEQAIVTSGSTHLILRTSWIYGTKGHNFMRTILRLAQEQKELHVVDDQFGAPTWCRSVALATVTIVRTLCTDGRLDRDRLIAASGIYHLSAAGATSWCGFARAILAEYSRHETYKETSKLKTQLVVPIASSEQLGRARRPHNSILSNEKISRMFGITLPNWHVQLCAVMEEIGL